MRIDEEAELAMLMLAFFMFLIFSLSCALGMMLVIYWRIVALVHLLSSRII